VAAPFRTDEPAFDHGNGGSWMLILPVRPDAGAAESVTAVTVSHQ
jgi:hypothetical protein